MSLSPGEPFQFCPECSRGRENPDPDCWRCGGVGRVEPYAPLQNRYCVREIQFGGRVFPRLEVLDPEVSV